MARLARLSIGGYPHLVAQAAGPRPIVADGIEGDRLLSLLRDATSALRVALHAYALVPQGLWLVATPADGAGLGRLMQSVGRRYVRWVNERRGTAGTLFGGRYRAAILEPETGFLDALRYVEARPVAVGTVELPEEYAWSSCRHHVGLAQDPSVQDHGLYWALGNTPFERQAAYRVMVHTPLSRQRTAELERGLRGGWVIGSPAFVRQIGPQCVRRPTHARAGRPRRSSSAGTSTPTR
jgi:REP-associated tyrosine transposase